APALAAMTVRPPTQGAAVPANLGGAVLVPADYRAVGKFPNYFRTMITRMVPIEGILAYHRDRVIDVKSTR
ncbi:MAG TPA: hypothetical protein VF655_01550, partial [Allosphingosinicella sp.]